MPSPTVRNLIAPGLAGAGRRRYMQRVLSLAPIGYWPMDEASGTVARNLGTLGAAANGAYTGVSFNVPGAELIGNGGFETAGAGGDDVFGSWVENKGTGVISSTTTAGEFRSGSTGVKLASIGGDVVVLQQFNVVPGQQYTYSFWARGDGTNAGSYGVLDVTADAWIRTKVTTGVTGTTFQQVTYAFTAPANCVAAKVYCYAPNVNGGIAYFDDVSVQAVPPNGIGDGKNAPYFDGTGDYCNIYSAALAGAFNGAEGSLVVWARVANAGVWTDGAGRQAVNLNVIGATSSVRIYRSNDVNNRIVFFYQAGGVLQAPVALGLSTTGWMCLAMTWSKSGDAVKAFVNGSQVDTTKTGLGVWANSLANTTNCIGASSTSATEVWSGDLAHVQLYSRALAPATIAVLARAV